MGMSGICFHVSKPIEYRDHVWIVLFYIIIISCRKLFLFLLRDDLKQRIIWRMMIPYPGAYIPVLIPTLGIRDEGSFEVGI